MSLRAVGWGVALLAAGVVAGAAWSRAAPEPTAERVPDFEAELSSHPVPGKERSKERRRMVESQLHLRDIADPRVLAAMEKVERHLFVPKSHRPQAYADHPLPIGHGQTISQPYIVALMSELLDPQPDQKVLEIGTGSGYAAAVLSLLVEEVYTLEIVEPLAESAKKLLAELGYDNVHVRAGDGYRGWPEEAPFDAIVLTAAPPEIPQPLIDQLAIGGRMVLPVGEGHLQDLKLLTRTADGVETRSVIPVRFVPMTGEARRLPPE